MVKSPLWLRVLAPCLALSVGGGYVWMRHKKAEAAEIQAQAAEAEAAKKRTMVLPGSKAPARFMDAEVIGQEDAVLPPPPPEDAKVVEERPESVRVMPGSKIGIIELDDLKDTRVLPSSKSGGVFQPEDLKEKNKLLPGSKSLKIELFEDLQQQEGKGNNNDSGQKDPKRQEPLQQKQEPAKPAEP